MGESLHSAEDSTHATRMTHEDGTHRSTFFAVSDGEVLPVAINMSEADWQKAITMDETELSDYPENPDAAYTYFRQASIPPSTLADESDSTLQVGTIDTKGNQDWADQINGSLIDPSYAVYELPDEEEEAPDYWLGQGSSISPTSQSASDCPHDDSSAISPADPAMYQPWRPHIARPERHRHYSAVSETGVPESPFGKERHHHTDADYTSILSAAFDPEYDPSVISFDQILRRAIVENSVPATIRRGKHPTGSSIFGLKSRRNGTSMSLGAQGSTRTALSGVRRAWTGLFSKKVQ